MADNPLDALLADHPDLESIRRVADEAERRGVSRHRLSVHRIPPGQVGGRPLAAPGSAVLLVARPGSSLLMEARRGLESGEAELMHEVAERIYTSLVDRQPVALEEAVDLFVRQGVSVDLSYRGVPLVQNVFLPDDLELAAFPMPYTGGSVDSASFELTMRVAEDREGWLDAILVIHEPELTEIERAALDLVPDWESGINIGKSAMCYAITAVTVFVVVAGATYACPGTPDVLHLDDDAVARIGPQRTARELLALRRQSLERRSG